MSQDYRDGFREALRVLKREVDEHPRWGAGDIYERLSELLEGRPPQRGPDRLSALEAAQELAHYAEHARRIAKLETADGACDDAHDEVTNQLDVLRKEVDELKLFRKRVLEAG